MCVKHLGRRRRWEFSCLAPKSFHLFSIEKKKPFELLNIFLLVVLFLSPSETLWLLQSAAPRFITDAATLPASAVDGPTLAPLCHCQPFYLRSRFRIRLRKKSKSKWMDRASQSAANSIRSRHERNACCCQRANHAGRFAKPNAIRGVFGESGRTSSESRQPKMKGKISVSPVKRFFPLLGFFFFYLLLTARLSISVFL